MSKSEHEAFVYQWNHIVDGTTYVGYHTGHPDDGYISSSDSFNSVYVQDPGSFKREILAVGTTAEMKAFETGWLRGVDAQHDENYYNKWNNQGEYSPEGFKPKAEVETIVGILERAGVEKGKATWRDFYTITINDTLISSKPSLITPQDDRNLHKLIGKPVECQATWVGKYAYFYPKNIKAVEE